MENHICEGIYDIIRSSTRRRKNYPLQNARKQKIVQLHSLRMNDVMLDTRTQDTIDGEEPTLFHNFRMNKRRA